MANNSHTYLTAEQVAEILGKSRQKGAYGAYVVKFQESGEAGVNVSEDFPGKNATAVASGLRNAIAKAEIEHIVVVTVEDTVFMLNRELAEVAE